MKPKNYRIAYLIFYTGYLGIGLLATTVLACIQLSGSTGVLLFITNDVLTNWDYALFVSAFPLSFCVAYFAGLFFLRLPAVDYLNTVVVINAAGFALLGLGLSTLRLNLLSRTVFLSEFILCLCLLIIFYHLRNRFFPRHVAVLENIPLEPFQCHPAISATHVTQAALTGHRFHAVVGDLRNPRRDQRIRLLSELAGRKIKVFDANLFIEQLWGRVSLDKLTPVEIETFIPPALYSRIKRAIELAFITFSLPLTLGLGLLIAVAIRLDSNGPVFFLQRRVGQSGSTFVMWKFRSMVHATESVTRFAEKTDSRITRVGGFLRRSRLDELPQLWNVVKGEMSLIGPRPEQESFVERYREVIPFFDFRHTVPPGITGWAQVMYGYADSDERARAKLEYDFYYIKRMSAWIDVLVAIKTVRTIIFGIGAR